jgi:hypothetical protein
MYPSRRVFTRGFNTTLLRHIAITKCVNGCPKIIPDAGLVADVKLKFRHLYAHLTWIFSIFSPLWGYLKTKILVRPVDNTEETWRRIQEFVSEIKLTPGIFQRLRVYFSRRAEPCIRGPLTRKPFRAHLEESKNGEVINRSFVCSLLLHNPLNLLSI